MTVDDLTGRIDLDALYPAFRARYVDVLAACRARGFDYFAISGTRSDAEQNALFAQGRTAPGSIVTNARAGESDHNFGVGVDACLDKDLDRAGLQPGWSLPDYLVLAEEAKRLGLNALYRSAAFREGPHVGLDIRKFGITHAHLRGIQERGGMSAVWSFLDGFGPWF